LRLGFWSSIWAVRRTPAPSKSSPSLSAQCRILSAPPPVSFNKMESLRGHDQPDAMAEPGRIETTASSAAAHAFVQATVDHARHSYCSSSDGLGLYGFSFPQPPQTPALYPSSPQTTESWARPNEPLQATTTSEETTSSWTGNFEDFPAFTRSPMTWDQSVAAMGPAALGMQTPSGAGNFPLNHELPLSVGLASQRSSVSSSYPLTSDGYRSDDTEPTMYSPVKTESTAWYENFRVDITLPSGHPESFSPAVDPPDHLQMDVAGASGIRPGQIHINNSSRYSSVASSPSAVRSNVPTENDRTIRGMSMHSAVRDEEARYEEALAVVARTRTRRRNTSHSIGTYACEICGKCMSRKHNLKNHMRTHDKVRSKDHPCRWPGCSLAFTRQADLRRHEKSVSGIWELQDFAVTNE
jgi:Zinc finger, C2H2 type